MENEPYLTPQQRETMAFVQDYYEEHGIHPPYEVIATEIPQCPATYYKFLSIAGAQFGYRRVPKRIQKDVVFRSKQVADPHRELICAIINSAVMARDLEFFYSEEGEMYMDCLGIDRDWFLEMMAKERNWVIC